MTSRFQTIRSPLLLLATTLGVGACAHRVSVPIAEIEPDPGAELAVPAAARADTSWLAAARRDQRLRSSALAAPSRPVERGPAATPGSPAPTPPPAGSALLRPAGSARPPAAFGAISPTTVNEVPSVDALTATEGPTVLRAQVLLDRARFSVGVLDGRIGQNTAKAIYWFQETHGIPASGVLDSVTYVRLAAAAVDSPVVRFTVPKSLLRGPFVKIPSSVYQQAKLDCLCYSSPIEELAERFHTVPEVLRQLNPTADFDALQPGTVLWVPNVAAPPEEGEKAPGPPVARIHVSKSGEYVHALAADGTLLYHFPTTLGSEYDPSPDGEYHVTGVYHEPTFRYDPTLFSDVPDSRPTAKLPGGPNSPVGVVWIALSKEHVGIHGTPHPETIGVASSHGCVRLTNWDALRLAASVRKGVEVSFVP